VYMGMVQTDLDVKLETSLLLRVLLP
jgi:hypothetical protein